MTELDSSQATSSSVSGEEGSEQRSDDFEIINEWVVFHRPSQQLFSAKPISAGTRILFEKPTFVAGPSLSSDPSTTTDDSKPPESSTSPQISSTVPITLSSSNRVWVWFRDWLLNTPADHRTRVVNNWKSIKDPRPSESSLISPSSTSLCALPRQRPPDGRTSREVEDCVEYLLSDEQLRNVHSGMIDSLSQSVLDCSSDCCCEDKKETTTLITDETLLLLNDADDNPETSDGQSSSNGDCHRCSLLIIARNKKLKESLSEFLHCLHFYSVDLTLTETNFNPFAHYADEQRSMLEEGQSSSFLTSVARDGGPTAYSTMSPLFLGMGLFQRIGLIPHSCASNCVVNVIDRRGMCELRVTMDIPTAGIPLTRNWLLSVDLSSMKKHISVKNDDYRIKSNGLVSSSLPNGVGQDLNLLCTKDRRTLILRRYHFLCQCARCLDWDALRTFKCNSVPTLSTMMDDDDHCDGGENGKTKTKINNYHNNSRIIISPNLCDGILVSRPPNREWECTICKRMLSSKMIMERFVFGKEQSIISKMKGIGTLCDLRMKLSVSLRKRMYELLNEAITILHKTHWVVIHLMWLCFQEKFNTQMRVYRKRLQMKAMRSDINDKDSDPYSAYSNDSSRTQSSQKKKTRKKKNRKQQQRRKHQKKGTLVSSSSSVCSGGDTSSATDLSEYDENEMDDMDLTTAMLVESILLSSSGADSSELDELEDRRRSHLSSEQGMLLSAQDTTNMSQEEWTEMQEYRRKERWHKRMMKKKRNRDRKWRMIKNESMPPSMTNERLQKSWVYLRRHIELCWMVYPVSNQQTVDKLALLLDLLPDTEDFKWIGLRQLVWHQTVLRGANHQLTKSCSLKLRLFEQRTGLELLNPESSRSKKALKSGSMF